MNAPRAVAAELRSLIPKLCHKCGAGLITTTDQVGRRYHYDTESTTPCPSSLLHIRLAEIEQAIARKVENSRLGRPRVILSPMEVKELWEQGLSQNEILRKLTAIGAPVSKGTLAKAVITAREAGNLDLEKRAAAIAKRGGLDSGGRRKKSPKDRKRRKSRKQAAAA